MTTMIEALKQAIALADILPPAPGEEANPADILATYAKGAIAEYEAALAARDAELAAMRELIDEVLVEFADAIPYVFEYFDDKWGYSRTLASARERLKSGQRGRQLAELLKAVGEWEKVYSQYESPEPLPDDIQQADMKLSAAYRAVYPE